MKRAASSILGIVLFLMSGMARAQTFTDSVDVIPRKSSAFQLGLQIEHVIRTGYSSQMNYEYKPVLIQVEFQKPFLKSARGGWQWEYFIQPQINTVRFRELGASRKLAMVKTFEAGINAGLILLKPLMNVAGNNQVKLYALGSLGPHYVGASPSRQAKGFLFSDNFRLGLRVPVRSFLILDLRTGIRHLSNASLKSPNGGLDDIMFGAGISFVKN